MTPKRILALSLVALTAGLVALTGAGWTWDDRIMALIRF